MIKLNVIIPAAGYGSRFGESKYKPLKPFIEFLGKSMIEHVIDIFTSNIYDVKIYIILREESKIQYDMQIKYLENKFSNVKFLSINKLSEGPTATVLHFYDLLNNDDPVLLANCDQLVDVNFDDYINKSLIYDGSLLVFDNEHSNKWSFVKLNEKGLISKVVAKEPISDLAVCGWYFWKRSKDFIKYGILQIVTQTKASNEYYLCPVYNFAIAEGKNITPIVIKKEQMHGVGTPSDLDDYLKGQKCL